MKPSWQDALVLTIILPVLVRWGTEKIVLLIEKLLVRTEREAIEWLHYRHRAARKGHIARKPVACEDDGCYKVTK